MSADDTLYFNPKPFGTIAPIKMLSLTCHDRMFFQAINVIICFLDEAVLLYKQYLNILLWEQNET